MARGGYRPGAGRKAKLKAAPDVVKPVAIKPEIKERSPLEYMLDVMNDLQVEVQRRDRMAIAAAPFVHVRAGETKPGKKELADHSAQTAGVGTTGATTYAAELP